ncbi:cysteine methyltransferase [Amycolatopsis antarctica]|uniref:Methylated-DNA--protein-cysteine methyltransferase n=1 Tax=Amycolatopsis antarctica TaxID=1854586 RepID=A0A263CWV9_9PSEU|nr:methylated-DNA--[protein]-cysteine S-methyltransferase [Amycolatopsis antarctica]OZM70622.1 cysteine methyltransferase [Amycolatopsis antarctica]
MSVTHTVLGTPLGDLTVVANDDGLTGVYFEGHRRMPDPDGFGPRSADGFAEAERQFGEYFAGERTRFDLALAPEGNEFQRRVWTLLTEIPYGHTRSYGDLAAELGDPLAPGHALAQAVGSANGRNPLSVVVPCHRVVGADGNLVGYAGGLARKRFLLDLEEPSELAASRLF